MALDVASQGLKDSGVIVYGIGVGKAVDTAELVLLASGPEFVLQSGNFGALQSILNGINEQICKGEH